MKKNKSFIDIDGVIYTDREYKIVKELIDENKALKILLNIKQKRIDNLMKRLHKRNQYIEKLKENENEYK